MNDDIYTLAKQVIDAAKNKGLTIATAESCTGGGIGAALTAIAGSSKVYAGGIISYSNDAKINLLNVQRDTIKKHGAVSKQTAKAMAEGVLKTLFTDLAISVTGIAGPTGGTEGKPIGTVWIGLAQKENFTQVEHFKFANEGRERVQADTIVQALKLLQAMMQSN